MGKIYMVVGDYAMREIEEDDLPTLLSWRNSPEIHAKMLTDHVITWEEHLAWFKKCKEQNPPLNFVFTYHGKLSGYLGYPKYDPVNMTCDIGDYLGPGLNLPVDAGAHLGGMLLRYAFVELGVQKIITSVFVYNRRVLKMIKMAGFKVIKEDNVLKDGVYKRLTDLELNFDDWSKSNNL